MERSNQLAGRDNTISFHSSVCLLVSACGGSKRLSIAGFEGTTDKLAEDFLTMERGQIVTIYGRKATSAVWR